MWHFIQINFIQIKRVSVLLLVAMGLTACGGSLPSLPSLPSVSSLNPFGDKKEEDKPEIPAPKLYADADKLLEKKSYEAAAKKFAEVDRQHPYSPHARRAIVMSAYSYYKDESYPEAIQGARRYLTLHPGTKEAALAQHIMAMSYYDQIRDANRDQNRSRKALAALKTLVQRYPESEYAKEAQNRIRITIDVIAASEMTVGRYYLKRHQYLGAVNRFKVVVEKYQTTKHVEEALMRLTEAYLALGITKEAQATAAVLGHNFPQSRWYKDAFNHLQKAGLSPQQDQGSWIARAWKTSVSAVRGKNRS